MGRCMCPQKLFHAFDKRLWLLRFHAPMFGPAKRKLQFPPATLRTVPLPCEF